MKPGTMIAWVAACCFGAFAMGGEKSLGELEKEFREMPMEARRMTGPLFWMHGTETKGQLERELGKVVEGGNGMLTTEPRPHNDWLGEGWYRDLKIVLDYARKNDLKVIIYDDYWWPSQMMGGRVPAEYGSKRLVAADVKIEGNKAVKEAGYGDGNLIAVIAGKEAAGGAIDGKSLVDLTKHVKEGVLEWSAPEGNWHIMKFTWEFVGKVGSQKKFHAVDGADKACTEWFIQTVYQPHYDRFKDDFGKTVIGYFYDEPETPGDWGREVGKVIEEKGLDLGKLLVGYKYKLAGDEQAAAYYTYLNCFAEAWGRTMYGGMSEWCRKHNVISMGHFMEHNDCLFSRKMSAGNMMQLQKYSDWGGIDLVCDQVYPGQRKMGLYQMPKIASSISHTYDKANDLAFCEIYGGYGQKLTYPQMKWLVDWEQVRGTNVMIPHSFNPKAPFDRDFPPYFYNGGYEPRWALYRVWADYTNRLSLMLTGGRHECPIAFLHVGQSYHVGKNIRPEQMTSTLQDGLLDCDWVLYDAWEESATLKGKEIQLHKENYRVLMMPAVEVIPYATLVKAKEFFDRGGVVVAYGMLPSKSATLGKSSEEIRSLVEAIWGSNPAAGTKAIKTNGAGGRSYFLSETASVKDVRGAIVDDAGIKPVLDVKEGETGNWLHVLHRVKAGRDVFLVCNQNVTGGARKFTLEVQAEGSPQCWDAMRNELTSVPFARKGKRVEMQLTLEDMESVLIVFGEEGRQLPARIAETTMKPATSLPIGEDAEAPREADLPLPVLEKGKPMALSPVKGSIFHGKVEVPAAVDLGKSRVYLEMDEIKPEDAANVSVNGKYVGGFIGKPYRIDVTRYLKPGTNTIRIAPFAPKEARLAVY